MSWNEASVESQAGKIAIVTGANSGIGFETARVLAARGATVVLACRNMVKASQAVSQIHKAVPGAQVSALQLDLGSLTSVREFASSFSAAHGRLDLLINNAGVMVPPYGQTEDGFELQIGTNHLGHFALTGRLLPLLLKTRAPRVVNVSSSAHYIGRINFRDLHSQGRYIAALAYGQSKLANLLFTFELSRRARRAGLPLIVSAAHPGWTATNLQAHVPAARFFNPFMAMKPLDGALPTLYAATAADVRSGDFYGPRWFMWGAPTRARTSWRARDEQVANKLWELSTQLTGVAMLDAAPASRSAATETVPAVAGRA